MLYTPETKKAMQICFDFHKNQFDRGGTPYVFHPWHIAEQMTTENETITALLHDTIEDGLDINKIIDANFNPYVLRAILAITRKKNETYNEYITRISQNIIATTVKRQDLLHNMDQTRLSAPQPKSLTQRYIKAYSKLTDAIDYSTIHITQPNQTKLNGTQSGKNCFNTMVHFDPNKTTHIIMFPETVKTIDNDFIKAFLEKMLEKYRVTLPDKIQVKVHKNQELTQMFENAMIENFTSIRTQLIQSTINEFNQ
jgi:hypothetical protein